MHRHLFTAMLAIAVAFQGPAFAQPDEIQEAAEAYHSANFDRAIEMFLELASSSGVSTETQVQCFHYLSRAYMAKHMTDEARAAIEQMLSLEPPVYEFNPDAEPPPLMHLYYKVRTERDGYKVYKSDGTIQTIAVVDFTNGSIGKDPAQYEPLRMGLASMMINYLGGATGLKVVERERLNWLLDELDLQRDASRVDQATAVTAGKLLGAQSVLIGSFIINDKNMYVGTRLVDVETGEVLLGEQLFGKQNDVFELIQELSLKTAETIKVELEKDQLGAEDETSSLEALMAYSEGLNLLEQVSYREAYLKFKEALEHGASYARAEMRVQSLGPMLR